MITSLDHMIASLDHMISFCTNRFTDDQLFLVMCRIKLLSYLDRLSLMQVCAVIV